MESGGSTAEEGRGTAPWGPRLWLRTEVAGRGKVLSIGKVLCLII